MYNKELSYSTSKRQKFICSEGRPESPEYTEIVLQNQFLNLKCNNMIIEVWY